MSISKTRRPAVPAATWITQDDCKAFAAAGTTAHRIASGPDGWVERLDEDALISYKHDAALEEFSTGLEGWCAPGTWQPARVFSRYLPRKNAERVAPILRSGDASLALVTVVTEANIRYELDFGAGYSHGLFLDQRGNRAMLHSLRPTRLLNTFAYTCSFSVVAARAGAETLSVDLSKKSLERGKRNFALNDIPDSGHRFIADDVLDLLPRLGRRGERFDAIILDPPTFSRGKNGRLWQVEQHFADLLSAALDVARPKCAILLSTNCTTLDAAALEQLAHAVATIKNRTAEYLRVSPAVDFPPGHGASTVWMLLN